MGAHHKAAGHFGRQFDCWNKPLCEKKGRCYKGRACCEKIDAQFRHVESELYNLWPVVGLVNQARSNYHFVALLNKAGFYGCGLKFDTLTHKAEPPNHAKGIIARAYLFMAFFYGITLDAGEYELFLMWHKAYPPSAWEITWATDVAAIEGYSNPYISPYTL